MKNQKLSPLTKSVFTTILVFSFLASGLDGVAVAGASPALTTHQTAQLAETANNTTINDVNKSWNYEGGWEITKTRQTIGGQLHISSAIGDSATITISGSTFILVYSKDRDFGTLDVYIDGTMVKTVNQNNSRPKHQSEWTSPKLSAGKHAIKFVHAGGNRVSIDALRVRTANTDSNPIPTTNQSANATPTSEVVSPANTQVPSELPTMTAGSPPTELPTLDATSTATFTSTPAPTFTQAPTSTPTSVPTQVPTFTQIPTSTLVPTGTATSIPTQAPTFTPLPTSTATSRPTEVPTFTSIPTSTATSVPTQIPTFTLVPTSTATGVPTQIPTLSGQMVTSTFTPTATSTSSQIPSPTFTSIPTQTPTLVPTSTPSLTPTSTSTTTPTSTSIPTGSAQQTLYVDGKTGSDSNPGTSTSPLRTIQQAVNVAMARSEIRVLANSYNERVAIATTKSDLVLACQSSGQCITKGFDVFGTRITVQGFKIQNATLAGIEVRGKDNSILNNEVTQILYNGTDADGMRAFGSGHVFRGNYIHDICSYSSGNCGTAHIDCLQTWAASDRGGAWSNGIFEANTCVNTEAKSKLEAGHAMMLEGGVHDIVIRNNIFIVFSGINAIGGTRNTVLNNTFIGQGTYNLSFEPIGFWVDDSSDTARNNIFVNFPNCSLCVNNQTGFTGDHNLYWQSHVSVTASTSRGDLINIDPVLNGSYYPMAGSPVIDAGYNLGSLVLKDWNGVLRPKGNGYDIGAFERP